MPHLQQNLSTCFCIQIAISCRITAEMLFHDTRIAGSDVAVHERGVGIGHPNQRSGIVRHEIAGKLRSSPGIQVDSPCLVGDNVSGDVVHTRNGRAIGFL